MLVHMLKARPVTDSLSSPVYSLSCLETPFRSLAHICGIPGINLSNKALLRKIIHSNFHVRPPFVGDLVEFKSV